MTQTALPPRSDRHDGIGTSAGNGNAPEVETQLRALRDEIEHGRDVQGAWMLFTIGLAVMAMLVALVAGYAAIRHTSGRAAAASSPTSSKSLPATAKVKLSEFALTPNTVTVAEGATLTVTNGGTVEHNLAIKGQTAATAMLKPGESAKLSLAGLASGMYTMICAVPGHEAAGMTAMLHIGNAASATATKASTAKDATIDFNAMPKANWHAFDPTLQPSDGGTVHDVTFHTTDKLMEVAPGVKQMMWTFNDQVPGPTLRGKVGDVFNVTLVNDGTMGHSIDFHASKVSPSVQMRTINPGESLVYQFKADYAGIFMYHCGTAPALHHIGNGMYGAVIIDPPALDRVDHE
ncbi:MAG TPA: multicopper oxidase domain-containing protein, partial [Acidimicrobiales bacterium]|nr:multicopper oxidase domain-containing protein [Acidimicrobiales bacterium]